jgi:hypothetical protein
MNGTKKARVFVPDKPLQLGLLFVGKATSRVKHLMLERLFGGKNTNLLVPFVRYEDNKVL